MALHELATDCTDTGTDRGGKQQRRGEQAHDEAADRADAGPCRHLTGAVLLHVDLAVGVAREDRGSDDFELVIGGLREGQTASFGVDAYPGRVFEGRVMQVRNAPITVLNVVTYDVIIEVDNRDLALKP